MKQISEPKIEKTLYMAEKPLELEKEQIAKALKEAEDKQRELAE